MTIKTKYKLEQSVYIKNDPAQLEYLIIGIVARPGSISYELSYLGDATEVYEFELSDTKDVLKVLDLDRNDDN